MADIELGDGLGALSGEMRPPGPVRARWAAGRDTPDPIVWTTRPAPVLMSDQVVTVLRDSGLRGWSTYEVDLSGRDGTRFRGYHGLSVHGRCGPIDPAKAVRFSRSYGGGVYPVWMGLYFDPDTWDGSDVFMPAGGSGRVLVADAVVRAFTAAGIGNVQLTPLPDVDMHGQLDTDPLERAMFRIRDRIDDRMEPVGFDRVGHPERVFAVIMMLVAEVDNGGFAQYMFNASGDRAGLVADALREVGAAEMATVCERFFALLPEGRAAGDQDARQAQLDATAEAMGEDAFDRATRELEARFHVLADDLDRRLVAHARKHGL